MTTVEHALLGADLVLATGLNRRFGWQLAALAGVCAVLPDWDGLTILWSIPLFDTAHRSWGHGLLTSAFVAIVASYSHLLADIIVSGTATLADWDVKIFFPFSDKGIVYPLVPWGDVGNTVILLLGMFAMLRWNNRVQTIAVITLLVSVHA